MACVQLLFSCQTEELTVVLGEGNDAFSGINVPENTSEYITYRVDDQNAITYTEGIDCFILSGTQLILSYGFNNAIDNDEFLLDFERANGAELQEGLYEIGSVDFNIDDSNGNAIGNQTIKNIEARITYLGNQPGDYVDMNFSGTFRDDLGALHTIVGLVHVLIDLR